MLSLIGFQYLSPVNILELRGLQFKARFKRRISNVPNITPTLVD